MELLSQNPSLNVHWIVLSGGGQRAEEARQSADRFLSRGTGTHDVRLFEFRDSYFPTQWSEIKDTFHTLSRDIQPDLIFTHRRDDAHQDHRVASELTWCTFRSHFVLEYEIAKYEGDLGQPNIFFPISAANAQAKCDLLVECFPTQTVKPWFDDETFRAMLRLRGLECNSESRYAEAFYCRKMSLTTGIVNQKYKTSGSFQAGASHVDCD